MSRERTYLLSLGSNIEPERWIPEALCLLRERFTVEAVSPHYDVGAVGAADQPRYVNLAVRLRTDVPPRALRAACRHLEMRSGRVRGGAREAPRTLDLDVVFGGVVFGGVVSGGPRPEPLHPDLLTEGYVLVPCADVWPDAPLEALGSTLGAEAAARFPGWGAERRMKES